MKLFPYPGLNRPLSVVYYLCLAIVLILIIAIAAGVPKTADSFMNYFVTAGVFMLINVAIGSYGILRLKKKRR